MDEARRVLLWLKERVGEIAIAAVTKEQLRGFRTDLARLKRLRGTSIPFAERLTDVTSQQIKSDTAIHYWKEVQGLFRWSASEGLVDEDLAAGIVLSPRKGDAVASPEVFSPDELERLLRSPLYAGYAPRGQGRWAIAGDCRTRDGHWWSGLLFMHTGLRAGELAQLLPTEFVFDGEVPHLKVRRENDEGSTVKSVKTNSSVREVPLLPVLLDLGLRAFVETRAKREPRGRVFSCFKVREGRSSEGLTKFWGRYLKRFDLWKPGRSTHVWRHTLVNGLRAGGASDEDIGAIVGHSTGTVTSRYGGSQPLARKLKTMERLSLGLDLRAVLDTNI